MFTEEILNGELHFGAVSEDNGSYSRGTFKFVAY